jgi:Na+-translocating ferredoxin:NAD+ oxidoreductase RnfC subunit
MGIVGAGGAGFPAHVKINATCEIVIANGAECEPLLQNDSYVMETEAQKIVEALSMVMEATRAKRGYIAVKAKNEAAVEALREQIVRYDAIELSLLDNFYPAGDEQVLVYEITGRVVPEADIPLAVGCIVLNVETLRNISNAVTAGKPVTCRTVTCIGEVQEPKVLIVPLGTPVRDVLDRCGGATVEEPGVILGGPLMGEVTTDIDTPVDKLTGGLVVLGRDHGLVTRKTKPLEVIVKQSRSVCCQCTFCSELCPRELLGHNLYPHAIMRQIQYGLDEVPAEIITSALLCSECGLCEVFACPMGLSPASVNKAIKEQLAEQQYRASFPARELVPHEMRSFRKVPAERIVQRAMLNAYDIHIRDRGDTLSPAMVELPLKQHRGAAAVARVSAGEQVREGDLVGEIPEGNLSARVHASISGTVTYVDVERVLITAGEEQ